MSPAQIEILLWYHTRPVDYAGDLGQKYVDEQTAYFTEEGLLDCDLAGVFGKNTVYKMTEQGHFYVEHGICAVPLPVQTFAIPHKDTTP